MEKASRKKSPPPGKPVTAHGMVVGEPGMPDRVWASVGLTINLGDFNSGRVDAGMSTDVRHGETVSEAYERVYESCVPECSSRIAELRSELGSGQSERKGKSRR